MYGVLGQDVVYQDQYNAQLLFAIPRQQARQALTVGSVPLDKGHDIWNAYELSWLNEEGMPQVAVGRFTLPALSPCIIESKSFKLYLNSFNQTHFPSWNVVRETMENDLSQVADASVQVELFALSSLEGDAWQRLPGDCLDEQAIAMPGYDVSRENLVVKKEKVEEVLHSHLLRSNCPMTNQPDWGSVLIQYKGFALCHKSLLRYLVGFRKHQGFHEQCVEQIFLDLAAVTQADWLSVHAFYTRRGGLDINPWRHFNAQEAHSCVKQSRFVRQ